MSNEQILQNAQHADTTRADGAPNEREARRQAIMKESDYWADGPKTKALRAEMARIVANADVVAREDAARTEAAAKTPASEKRRVEITRMLISGDVKPEERAALTKELRQIIASQATDAERQDMVNAPVEQLRERFGLDAENKGVLAPLREKWDSEGEAEVLATFADHGVPADAVQAVMGWYAARFNGALGDPANADVDALAAEFKSFATKRGISPKLADALVNWQRQRLGRGGDA